MRKKASIKKPLKTLQQTEKMISVVIDSRTRIYIKEGRDPEEARKKFLETYMK
jgi:hypothetical protein